MSFASLGQFLATPRDGSLPIALRPDATLSFSRLRADVAFNMLRLRALAGKRAMLVTADAYEFVVGLLALAHARWEIILPPNAQPGTLAALRDAIDIVVTDEPVGGAECFILRSGDGACSFAPFEPADTRIEFFTSGSTGEPKRITKTLGMIEAEAAMLEQLWGPAIGQARFFGTVGHQHAYGLPFRVIWPLCTGRGFASTRHHIWEALLRDMPTPGVIVSSPAHLTRLAGIEPLPSERQPRRVFTAGAPLPDDAAAAACRIFGSSPVEIFGSTDTGIVAWRHDMSRPGIWTPFPGVDVSSNPDQTTQVQSPFSPGSRDLGDRIELTDDGGFRLHGRVDRIAKIEGKRVSLPELEQQIARLPFVDEVAVAVIEETRSFIGAVAVLSAAGRDELSRLRKFRFERMLRQHLSAEQELVVLPRRWRFVARLPSDHMGKRRLSDILALLTVEPADERRPA